MIRAALYARVSTTNGQDTRVQLDQLHQVAERQGWQVVATFTDDGISGAKGRAERPALNQLLLAVTRRDVDLVAAWSVDRLGRSLQDLLGFLDHLRVASCDLYLHQQGLDTRTPAGRMMFQLLGVFAEFERSLIQERVKAGLERAKIHGTRSGKPHGRPPASAEKLAAIEARLRAGLPLRTVSRDLKVRVQTVMRVRDQISAQAE